MNDGLENENFETLILRFEQCWQRGTSPAIADFLPSTFSAAERLRLLGELVCIDLEYRWQPQENNRGLPWLIEVYLRQFPELIRSDDLLVELIGEEYRARQRFADRPQLGEFLLRFEKKQHEIPCTIRQIDRELAAESDDSAPRPLPPITPEKGTVDPRAPLPYSDYVLRQLLGKGGMGKVYFAWQQSLDRPVAVKYLRKSFLHDEHTVRRFLEEARTVARLRHPHIIAVHGLGRTPGGGYFLVMDWIDGSDLAAVIQAGSVSIAQAITWTMQAGEAIQEAHRNSIVHCDLKPGNLLLGTDGQIRVTDFGMARSLVDNPFTSEGIEGTAPFMAPEQVSDTWGPISVRTDVYGLGAVLYTLLTGQPPWTGQTLADVLAKVVTATPITLPAALGSQLPQELVKICCGCLAKSPEERFPTVEALHQSLDDCLATHRDGK